MELEHSFVIPVPPEQAWDVLLDVEQIAPCMPGATVDSFDGQVISGRIKVKVGPVALTYAGNARFTERDEKARTVALEASGKETRGSGTASATVRSSLQDEGGQTRVVVHTSLTVTGRPAQFGRGVMAEVSGKIIERFASNLATLLAGGARPAADLAAGNGSASTSPASTSSASTGAAPAAAPAPAEGPAQAEAATVVPIEELHLPLRAFNSLRREGIHTVADLSARSEEELLAIANLGPQSVKEIKQKLADRGLALSETGRTAAATAGGGGTAAPGGAAAPVGAAGLGTASPTGAAPAGTLMGAEADGSSARAAGAASGPGARPAAATGTEAPPRAARPPDEDAIDLLSVAGFPVLKRALPVLGGAVVLMVVILRVRRRRRR